MGIPAYFKHLTEIYTGLVALKIPTKAVSLHLDLNCGIYHCVHKLQKTIPYNPANRSQWESQLCDAVCDYIKMLTDFVQPAQLLHIAIDGVVPMAKMRQQRQRRFKSAYLRAFAADTAAALKYDIRPQWDTNAITPGTEFMSILADRIRCQKFNVPQTIFSDSEEPGEGEHKIVNLLRQQRANDDYHVIYGLDADLIMLSLLQIADGRKIMLLREAVEFGKISLNAENKETLVYFDIVRLSRIILHDLMRSEDDMRALRDYVFLCSFLGNDFVPHGFSLTIHNDGIEKLIDIYITNVAVGDYLIICDGEPLIYHYNETILFKILNSMAEKEFVWLTAWRKSRAGLRSTPRTSQDRLECEMNILEEWPVQAEQMREELEWNLQDSDYYYTKLLGHPDRQKVARLYMRSLIWILRYYTGAAVDTECYYPWNIPPLWETLATNKNTLESDKNTVGSDSSGTDLTKSTKNVYITSAQQCAMVFPMASYSLVPAAYRHIPALYPEYFPTDFGFYVAGRRFFWQCEPIIPLLPASVLQNK